MWLFVGPHSPTPACLPSPPVACPSCIHHTCTHLCVTEHLQSLTENHNGITCTQHTRQQLWPAADAGEAAQSTAQQLNMRPAAVAAAQQIEQRRYTTAVDDERTACTAVASAELDGRHRRRNLRTLAACEKHCQGFACAHADAALRCGLSGCTGCCKPASSVTASAAAALACDVTPPQRLRMCAGVYIEDERGGAKQQVGQECGLTVDT
jgi:hypothetical protein